MPSTAFPARPRLADHVLPRRYLTGADERIVLCDTTTGRLVQIGPREWCLLGAADGTRDLEGIVLAAAREGAHARVDALRPFLDQLHQAGFLDDGIAAPPADPATAPSAPASTPTSTGESAGAVLLAERPVEHLPGFSLHCDGAGSCCRIYASVIFGPVEAARARSLLPLVHDGGARQDRVFMPERGVGPTAGLAVASRDARCVYLDDTDRCGLHAAGGPGGKPLGCNTYPTYLAGDGETVRASVSVECACVLASIDRPGGAPLLPESARLRRDLDETLVIAELPAEVAITPDARVPRAAFVAWSRGVSALPPSPDTAAALFALASAVDQDGLDAAAAARALAAPEPPPAAVILPFVDALHARAQRRAREDAAWRSDRDLARRATRWIARATGLLREPGALEALLAAPIPAPRSEDFYLRASLHGHRFVEGPPLVTALRDRALRLLVARALPLAFGADDLDPSCAHPLALVEAMLRGHGLDGYVEEV